MKYCQKTIELPLFYGSYKDGCGKPATQIDDYGRSLCEKHYNHWLKKKKKKTYEIHNQT